LVRRIAAIGEWRGARGWSAGALSIWARISGEQFSSTQPSDPSARTATHSCVRALARIVPSRTPRQLAHPQFHCGNPPPAAEPNTRISIIILGKHDSPSAGPGAGAKGCV